MILHVVHMLFQFPAHSSGWFSTAPWWPSGTEEDTRP